MGLSILWAHFGGPVVYDVLCVQVGAKSKTFHPVRRTLVCTGSFLLPIPEPAEHRFESRCQFIGAVGCYVISIFENSVGHAR